ncbi:MAG: hypothetical protein K2Y37_21195 [Pirellulales bacterium]|nr:hypothetical protein [Pirellulales bacterium]
MCKTSLGIAALLAASVCQLAAAADAVQLRWKFAPEQRFRYESQSETQTRTLFEGTDHKQTMQQKTVQSWLVEKVADDGSATLRLAFDRWITRIDRPGNLLEVDSASTKEPTGQEAVLLPLVKAVTGAPFSVKMSPLGATSEVTLPEILVKAVAARGQGNVAKEFFSEESLKAMVSQGSLKLPADPIEPGKTWEDTKGHKGMKVTSVYTYVGPEPESSPPLARIEMTARIDWADATVAGVKINIAEQSMEGVVHFDNEHGRLVDLEVTQKMALEYAQAGSKVRQEVQVHVTNKLLPNEDAPTGATTPAEAKPEATKPAE